MNELFKNKILPEQVLTLVNFDGKDKLGDHNSPLNTIQSEGTAGIYNILTEKEYALLADEVGLGKTYQALALITLVWNLKPDARILVVCPKENLQNKWMNDYSYFIKKHYKNTDDIVKTSFLEEPVFNAIKIDRLNDLATRLRYLSKNLFILRHTSFMRPFFVSDSKDSKALSNSIIKSLNTAKIAGVNLDNSKIKQTNLDEHQYHYANAFNELLRTIAKEGEPPIDLLIFDESQYLRNPENQTNSVFKQIFCPEKKFENHFNKFNDENSALINNQKLVKKWLFMTATPIHSSKLNILNTLNMIGINNFDKEKLIADEKKKEYKDFLKNFMIRRTRSYRIPQINLDNGLTTQSEIILNKHNYRNHDVKSSEIKDIDTFQKLSLALVQKNLVKLLEGNNKFKMGYLSSFESISSSINNSKKAVQVIDNGIEEKNQNIQISDYDEASNDSKNNLQKPMDDQFLDIILNSYESKFSSRLPHPKVDDIVEKVWNNYKNGEKSLVFTRRISSTHEIENRLNKKWEQEIEKRIESVYGVKNLWKDIENIQLIEEDDEESDKPVDQEEQVAEIKGADNFIKTSKKNESYKKSGNIFKFIVTFNENKSNDLIFEENYFKTFELMEIIKLEEVIKFIKNNPESILIEYNNSFDKSGKKLNQFQFYYRILYVFLEKSDLETNSFFEEVKKNIRANKIKFNDYKIDKKGDYETALLRAEILIKRYSFWDFIFENENYYKLQYKNVNNIIEHLKKEIIHNFEFREMIKTIISSQIRLTDLIIDLFYANGKEIKIIEENLKIFVDNLFNNENYSTFLKSIKSWHNNKVVVEKYFINKESILKKKDDIDLTIKNISDHLSSKMITGNYSLAKGISGQTGVSESVIKQFNSPGYPFAIICTDILKEGMDLHIFCKNIYHYGIAWTNGDMEQRNGRLDRNFSYFERELVQSQAIETKLNVFYPFIKSTVEQYQIQKVLNNVMDSAKILDSIDNNQKDEKEVDLNDVKSVNIVKLQDRLNALASDFQGAKKGEFEPSFDGITSIKFIEQKINFKDKIIELKNKLSNHNPDWKNKLKNSNSSFDFSNDKVSMQLLFVREISQYVIQFTKEKDNLQEVLKYSMDQFQKDDKIYYGLRIYLDNDFDSDKIVNLIDFAKNAIENPNSLDKQNLNLAGQIKSILDKNDKFSYILGENSPEHALHFNVELNDERSQKVKIYCYDNMLLISSKVAKIDLIKNNNTNEQKMTVEQAQEWVLRKNNHIDFGYFNYHNDYIRLSERYIIDTKNISTDENKLIDFIITLARFADIHEYYLTGENEN